MTTPLIILGLLTLPILLVGLTNRFTSRHRVSTHTAGCFGITLVFLFTGIGHFIKTGPMAEMLPIWVPSRTLLVYVTGVVELLAAIAVLVARLRRPVGWALIAMLIGFFPVNVYAAFHKVGMGGHLWGPGYLLIRIPLQIVLVLWVWWYLVRQRPSSP